MFSQPMVDDTLPAKQTTPSATAPISTLSFEDVIKVAFCAAGSQGRVYLWFMTIYWTIDACHGQAILTLHLSVGQVILFPYFDHCIYWYILCNFNQLLYI